jgi:hypothetical protein
MEARNDVVRVMRADGSGLHWIWRVDLAESPKQDTEAPPVADKPRRGRPPKHQRTEAINGDR